MDKYKARKSNWRCFKLPPCPSYDVEGTESWLMDMASSGLLLRKKGFFAGLAIFEKSEPCNIRYRLDAAPKGGGACSGNGGAPDDAVDMSEHYGWEYVASRGMFHIYRSKHPQARELNTDSLVQSMAINEVRKQERSAVISFLSMAVINFIIFFKGNLLLTMLNAGSGFILYGIMLWLCIFIAKLLRAVHMGRLRRKLASGDVLNHQKPWRGKAWLYYISKLVLTILIISWFVILVYCQDVSVNGVKETPLSGFCGQVPFATMEDFVLEGRRKLWSQNSELNVVKEWKDWLAPTIINWFETATVTLPDGRYFSGVLRIEYYETLRPWLAREVARECLRERRFSWSGGYEELASPKLDADYVAAFETTGIPTILIQKNCTVIQATFFQTSEYRLEFEDWARVIADSIK